MFNVVDSIQTDSNRKKRYKLFRFTDVCELDMKKKCSTLSHLNGSDKINYINIVVISISLIHSRWDLLTDHSIVSSIGIVIDLLIFG